jgi:pyruvate/2-oxoglutarate dehydrogenase complex dihydrolipoamide dehydrogenase (E3) component
MSVEKFDLVILGSGSTAFAAALRAQEMGKMCGQVPRDW